MIDGPLQELILNLEKVFELLECEDRPDNASMLGTDVFSVTFQAVTWGRFSEPLAQAIDASYKNYLEIIDMNEQEGDEDHGEEE